MDQERSELLSQLETERSRSAQLQQQIEVQSQLATVPETSLTPAVELPALESVRDRVLPTIKPAERKAAMALLDKFIREVRTEVK